MDRAELVDDFYVLLDALAHRSGGPRLLGECSATSGWPMRGVYFFFEPGERRTDGMHARVVRVGTHGLRPAKSTLWGRLSQHRGTVGGALAGGGNHRGSIFRLHVGEAMLARGGFPEEVSSTWGKGGSAPASVRAAEYPLECAVSTYIGAMPMLWLEVDDEPSPASDRGVIESGAIALLSNRHRSPLDPPSPTWLGRDSSRPLIRGSGLWNVRHVDEAVTAGFLSTLARYVERR